MKKKIVAAALACILCIGVGIGGTLAWLADKSAEVKNTFTYGDINIVLDESKLNADGTLDTATRVQANTFKLVPGDTQAKDPMVTVKKGSEACWLFVSVTASSNYSTFMSDPVIADGWTLVPGESNVYYREVAAVAADAEKDATFYVLGGTTNATGEVHVLDTVTKMMVNGLTAENYPTLTFQAYAVQKDNIATVADAWTQAKTSANYPAA